MADLQLLIVRAVVAALAAVGCRERGRVTQHMHNMQGRVQGRRARVATTRPTPSWGQCCLHLRLILGGVACGAWWACRGVRTIGLLSVLPIIWTTKHVVLHLTMQHSLVPHLAPDLVDVRARSAGEAHALLSLRQAVRSGGLWRAGPLDHWASSAFL